MTNGVMRVWKTSVIVILIGGNYGVMAVMPFANAALEAPAFGF